MLLERSATGDAGETTTPDPTTTAASNSGVTTSDILSAVDWSTPSVFSATFTADWVQLSCPNTTFKQ